MTIEDNGSGLTHDEIVQYLATIGIGYTRVLRQKTASENAVGYFGLGFLTAYVVADKVEFITTSYQTPDQGWAYSSKNGQQYHLKEIAAQPVGSRVILHLKDDFSDLADVDFLYFIIRKYCCLLPIDIYINDDDAVVNNIEVPWRFDANKVPELRLQKALQNFAKLFDHDYEPLAVFPIESKDGAAFNGIVWVQDGAYYANSDNRVTSIFIRGMHITDQCKELLPNWAGFIGCVIDSAALTPTASRESIKDDELFNSIKQKVAQALIDKLMSLASEAGPTWRRIVSRHNQSLLGAAVSDQYLFTAMFDKLSLPTSLGDLTVGEIIKRSTEERIHITMEANGGYEQLVCHSLGVPIVYGFRYAVNQFCKLLADKQGFKLVTLGSADSAKDLFPPTEVDAAVNESLTSYFSEPDASVVITRFEPRCLPLVKVMNQDALLKKRVDSDAMDEHIGNAALMLARDFTNNLEVAENCVNYVNVDNELIKSLGGYPVAAQQYVAQTVIDFSTLMLNQVETEREHVEVLESLTNNLMRLGENFSQA